MFHDADESDLGARGRTRSSWWAASGRVRCRGVRSC